MKVKKDYQKSKILFDMNEKTHESKMKKLNEKSGVLNSFFKKDKKISYVNVTIESGWSKSSINKYKDIYDMDLKPKFLHSFFVSDKKFFKNPDKLMQNIIEDINTTKNTLIKRDTKYERLYNDSKIQIEFGYKKPKQKIEYNPVHLKGGKKVGFKKLNPPENGYSKLEKQKLLPGIKIKKTK